MHSGKDIVCWFELKEAWPWAIPISYPNVVWKTLIYTLARRRKRKGTKAESK